MVRIRRIRTEIQVLPNQPSNHFLAAPEGSAARRLLRANMDDKRHWNEVIDYEEQLSRPQRQQALKLNSYGRKIEQVMQTLLRL